MSAFIIVPLVLLGLPLAVRAHCPLCTAGSGVLAVAAAWLGVDPQAIGVFIGAAALAMGFWAARYPKRRVMPGQVWILGLASFALTVLPILPLFDGMSAVNVFIVGELGSFLNRTYVVNSFLLGAVIGAALLAIAPAASRAVSRVRKGRALPFQGMAITFAALLTSSVVLQMAL